MNGPRFSRASQKKPMGSAKIVCGLASRHDIADFAKHVGISDLANGHFAIDTDIEGVVDRRPESAYEHRTILST